MDITHDHWQTAMDSQARAFLVGAQACSRLLRDSGRIIAITYSPSGRTGSWQPWVGMGAAKAALDEKQAPESRLWEGAAGMWPEPLEQVDNHLNRNRTPIRKRFPWITIVYRLVQYFSNRLKYLGRAQFDVHQLQLQGLDSRLYTASAGPTWRTALTFVWNVY